MAERGTVKWFKKERGHGAIARDNGPDVFVSYHALQDGAPDSLDAGDPVEIEIVETPQGRQAANVRKA
ncbi:MAG: cold shock domain-containing protein [Thermaerobacterales bacterium]